MGSFFCVQWYPPYNKRIAKTVNKMEGFRLTLPKAKPRQTGSFVRSECFMRQNHYTL